MTDPDIGIPDLVRRLGDDSKRLVTDEVQLAKLEVKESIHRVGKGALWMALAFGAGVVMLVALTIMLVTLIGQLVRGHMWVGALVTGVLELWLGVYLIKRGAGAYRRPSYSMVETRASLTDTAHWTSAARR
jgi:uncharacterized membrane protein YqjE